MQVSVSLSLNACQKRFLRTHKEVDLAQNLVVGLVLQVGGMEKLPHALEFESLDPLFRVSEQGPRFTAVEDLGDKRLVLLELACKAAGVEPLDPV